MLPDKKKHIIHRYIASNLISALIYSYDIHTATIPFEALITIFGLEKETDDFDDLIESNSGQMNHTRDDEQRDENMDIIDSEIGEKLKSSLYFQSFKKIKEDVEKVVCSNKINIYYSIKFIEYVLNSLMPFFSLWSAAGIKRYGVARDSNATAENLFKIKKHIELKGEKNIAIPRLIQKLEEDIKLKIKERIFTTKTTRRSKIVKIKLM